MQDNACAHTAHKRFFAKKWYNCVRSFVIKSRPKPNQAYLGPS